MIEDIVRTDVFQWFCIFVLQAITIIHMFRIDFLNKRIKEIEDKE